MKKFIFLVLSLAVVPLSNAIAEPSHYCPPGWHIGGTPLACQPPHRHPPSL